MSKEQNDLMEKIISLSKRRGFIYQGSEIYGGLAGTWDYGPLGVALKNNIKELWRKRFVSDRFGIYEVDAALIMNKKVWEASGHAGGFSDPMVECTECKKRFRKDHLEDPKVCPECGGETGEERQFNMMFKTQVGVTEDEDATTYLRPETAQGMFVNFKNIIDTFHPKLPFGMAQIGKAFRNEIAPRDFLFRAREFEQMEVEFFVKPEEWEEGFDTWLKVMRSWINEIGLDPDKVYELDVPDEDRAHYAKKTIDFEYDYPFGRKELYGLAYRTDHDLKSHKEASKVDLSYFDEENKERIIPHVIEPSLGLDRTVLAILCESYTEDELNGDTRTVLKLPKHLAPHKVAIFPLLKNKPELVAKAKEIFMDIRKEIPSALFDDNGNIGKRYRRQDEVGTPHCVTVDFDTLEDDSVTIRDRDTGEQKRVATTDLLEIIKED